MRYIILGCTALCAQQAGAAFAAEPAADTERVAVMVAPENDTQSGIPSGSALGLSASNSDSEVSLTLAPKNDGVLTRTGSTSWAITLKAPLDKDTGSGSFVTEQGLSNKFSAGFGLTRIFGTLGNFDTHRDAAVGRYAQKCERTIGATPEALAKPAEERSAFVREKCGTDGDVAGLDPEKLALYASPTDVRLIKRDETAHAETSVSILNVSASIGYNEYSFFSPLTFAESKDEKLSYAFSASFGINPSRGAPFFGAGYEYKREYEAPDKKIVCPVNANPAVPLECKSAVFGAPERNISHNVFALVRVADMFPSTRTDSRFRLPIAFEVRGAYDFHDKIFGLSVPIYFLFDDKGGFRGGAKFDWANRTEDSSEDEFKLGIFVVKSFDFFGL